MIGLWDLLPSSERRVVQSADQVRLARIELEIGRHLATLQHLNGAEDVLAVEIRWRLVARCQDLAGAVSIIKGRLGEDPELPPLE